MCGRFTHLYTWAQLHRLMRLSTTPAAPLEPRYNVAPQQTAPVVVQQANVPEAILARWGLIPSWAADESIAQRTINARSETASRLPAFREAFRSRRCVVPMSGFYEWQKIGARKQAWYIEPAASAGILLAAGLWESWRLPHAQNPLVTFTILTTRPNDLMQELHDRMPAFLTAADAERWLDPTAAPEHAAALLGPCPAAELRARRVGPWVNAPAHEGARCLEPPADGGTLFDQPA